VPFSQGSSLLATLGFETESLWDSPARQCELRRTLSLGGEGRGEGGIHFQRHAYGTALRTSRAFTLVEILVTIALLSMIVLGLFAVFNQVQRAFRSSMNQVDQLAAGRAVTEMLPRELEQITPCGGSAVTFAAQVIPSAPLTQSLPGMTGTPPIMRMNLLEDCFILLRQNQTWTGIGYCVRTDDGTGHLYLPQSAPGTNGVGSLYRYAASLPVLYYNSNNARDPLNGTPNDPSQLYTSFAKACQPGSANSLDISNRICDGVIHFYLTAYATNGFPIVWNTSYGTNAACFRPDAYTLNWRYSVVRPALTVQNSAYPGNLSLLRFWSNAVPASVELQFGVLEQHALDRYNSIGDATARFNYLQRPDNTSRVHLFRQRIPIRNVNTLAYQ
jgi:prepilin-type N-terminal cleavage/methylation domain-containing protein